MPKGKYMSMGNKGKGMGGGRMASPMGTGGMGMKVSKMYSNAPRTAPSHMRPKNQIV